MISSCVSNVDAVIEEYVRYIAAYCSSTPVPPFSECEPYIGFMVKLLADPKTRNGVIETDLLRYLRVVTYEANYDEFDDIIALGYGSQIGERLVGLLDNSDDIKRQYAVMCIANITSNSDDYYDELFGDTDIVAKLQAALQCADNNFLKDTVLSVANVCATRNALRRAVVHNKTLMLNLMYLVYLSLIHI